MNPEDKAKIQSFISDLEGLKSRNPEEKKFKDWKEKVEKKLEEVYGKNSDPMSRFQRINFFKFDRGGKSSDIPLNESERREYIRALDEAKRLLGNFA